MSTNTQSEAIKVPADKVGYNRFLLFVAGLGGLLYGIDVGIISGALPYLRSTFTLPGGGLLSDQQSSLIVAAVALGTIFSTLFAGMLADRLGRRTMMTVSGMLFVISVPTIALAHDYNLLLFGRLLQGVSGGLIGVVAPLYLVECLRAANRGRGTAVFQWMLTLGIMAASIIGLYFSHRVELAAQLNDPAQLFAAKANAWRSIFWVSLPPGILFVLGTFLMTESPRWLYRRGDQAAAKKALLRSRSAEQTELELKEMDETIKAEQNKVSSVGEKIKESLLHKKYVIPFLLACAILFCNQSTGINSIIGYNTTILIQAGLDDGSAHFGSTVFTIVNFLFTIIAVVLVDRKGRKFLLSLGTAGVVISMICVGLLFHRTEKLRVDVADKIQALVTTNQTLSLTFNQATAAELLGTKASTAPATLAVIYSYGDYGGATAAARSDDVAAKPVEISRGIVVPAKKFEAKMKHPWSDYEAAQTAPLKIDAALITPVPDAQNGWLTAILLYIYMAFFAVGPGVVVWLALSELMPTRIRSNGMSVALVINQMVSATIAGVFLPTVGKYGYSAMFFSFAACTTVYFLIAFFILPETKGKTLEEIEEHFEGNRK